MLQKVIAGLKCSSPLEFIGIFSYGFGFNDWHRQTSFFLCILVSADMQLRQAGLLPLESCTLFVTVLPIESSLQLWFVCRVCFRGACTGAIWAFLHLWQEVWSWRLWNQGFHGQRAKWKHLQLLCPALLLGLSQITLITTLNLPPFNMRPGWWWEKGWSCDAGTVQASAR